MKTNENPSIKVLSDYTLPVDYSEEGDRWLDLFIRGVQSRIDAYGGYGLGRKYASADFKYPHFELELRTKGGESQALPKLRILPIVLEDGSKAIYLELVTNEPVKREQIQHIEESILESEKKLNEENPTFEWVAVVTQRFDGMTKHIALKKGSKINGVSVKSAGKMYTEYTKSNPPYFGGMSVNVSWPILIEGKSSGYNWLVASRQASIDTNRIAALLSLAWNSTIILLQSPMQKNVGRFKISSSNLPEIHKKGPGVYKKNYKLAPKWLNKASTIVSKDEELKNALNGFHQGMIMSKDYPSYAAIALVASIEIIGKKIIGKKCPDCGRNSHANQRFRAGVDAVIHDQKEAQKIYGIFAARSDTAHEAILHADEEAHGSLSFPSLFKPESGGFSFIVSELESLKKVSRLLLTKALKEQLNFVESND